MVMRFRAWRKALGCKDEYRAVMQLLVLMANRLHVVFQTPELQKGTRDVAQALLAKGRLSGKQVKALASPGERQSIRTMARQCLKAWHLPDKELKNLIERQEIRAAAGKA
jgi:hypothetical protein